MLKNKNKISSVMRVNQKTHLVLNEEAYKNITSKGVKKGCIFAKG